MRAGIRDKARKEVEQRNIYTREAPHRMQCKLPTYSAIYYTVPYNVLPRALKITSFLSFIHLLSGLSSGPPNGMSYSLTILTWSSEDEVIIFPVSFPYHILSLFFNCQLNCSPSLYKVVSSVMDDSNGFNSICEVARSNPAKR